MTPLEAAQALDQSSLPTDDNGRCWFCDEVPGYEGHHGPCPWLALPQIIAALKGQPACRICMWEIGHDDDCVAWLLFPELKGQADA